MTRSPESPDVKASGGRGDLDVSGGVKPRINGEQRVAEATTCRVERQGVASRQAAPRLLRCAPALRVTRRNPLTQLAFMAGSRLPAVNDPLCENTAIQKVNPHILCSPLFGALGSPSTLEPLRSGQPSEASKQKGRSESERTSRRKQAPHEADSSGHLELPRVFLLCPMASADTEELRRTYWGSRRKLKAAILESTAVKVRKVWGAGRMTLEC